MFRKMRRIRQALSDDVSRGILMKGTHGVLALSGDNGYPYALPISYVYRAGRLYFHSAGEGHKIDAVRTCEKASFCVVEKDDVVPEEYTTYFRSVIAFGKIRIIDAEDEKLSAIRALADKYHPKGAPEKREEAVKREWAHVTVLEMEIEHISGKEAIELVKKRAGNEI